jgi:aryl-alcohol dehydrogenase-like predicted oxidoreductase
MEPTKKLNLEWDQLIERQIETGLIRKQFCKQENLGIHAFSYHKKKYLKKKNFDQIKQPSQKFEEKENTEKRTDLKKTVPEKDFSPMYLEISKMI